MVLQVKGVAAWERTYSGNDLAGREAFKFNNSLALISYRAISLQMTTVCYRAIPKKSGRAK
jgi:hypothetical protein